MSTRKPKSQAPTCFNRIGGTAEFNVQPSFVRHGGRHSGYYRDDACHRVYKYGYYHGRKARIGGTQCYDSYGNPYIVRGSRYVIEYY